MRIFQGKTTLNVPRIKISKNIGILYKARDSLSKEGLLSLYFAYIHTYINSANLAWASTIRTIDCMFLSCESTLFSCLNVEELLARSRREI